jgi:hypothetical protein
MFNYNLNEKNYVLDVANDSYKDILCKYTSTKAEKSAAKLKLVDDVRSEFAELGKKIIKLINSSNAFHPSNYKNTVNTIISTDREMSRKMHALAKIGLNVL